MNLAPARTRATRWGVDGAPAALGGFDELERHRDARIPRARAIGGPLPETHGGEGRLVGYLELMGSAERHHLTPPCTRTHVKGLQPPPSRRDLLSPPPAAPTGTAFIARERQGMEDRHGGSAR